MRKYGIDNFSISVVEVVDNSKLNEREQWWVSFYKTYETGYNATRGGDGRLVKDYDIEKIVDMFIKGLDRTQIAEILNIDRHAVSGILESRGFFFQKEKRVDMYTLDGKYEASFDSLKQASLACCGNDNQGSNISLVCQGKRRHALGHRWKYSTDLFIEDIGFLADSINMYSVDGVFEKNFIDSGAAIEYLHLQGEDKANHSSILGACKNHTLTHQHQWRRNVLDSENITPYTKRVGKIKVIASSDGLSRQFDSIRQAALFLCESGTQSQITYERNIKKYLNSEKLYCGYYWTTREGFL